MRRSLIRAFCLSAPFIFMLLTFVSCSSTKKIKYFQDIPDSGQLKLITKAEYKEPTIKVDDILTILIQTIDPIASQPINAANVGGVSSASMGTASSVSSLSALGGNQQGAFSSGYLVDKNGNVNVPVLGKINALGYTTSQLRDSINVIANKYYKDPTITVRFSNFKITVTGEVLRPGQYVVPNEKVSVLDALAMAGDLTIFGKRENVLLIRENIDGTKTPVRFNLKKSDVMSSPFYYLRQNDVIYVEPRKAKSDATDASQQKYITLAGALLSIILVLAYRVK